MDRSIFLLFNKQLIKVAAIIFIATSGDFSMARAIKTNPIQINVINQGAVPAWRANLGIGEWKEIPGSSMSRLIPTVNAPGNGRSTIIDAWNSLAIDPRDSSIYSVANGGHFDWGGNEVNVIRMSDDAPKWIEKKASTPLNQIKEYSSYYDDGAPTSRHSYYGVIFNQQRNRVLLLSGYWFGQSASLLSTMDGYSLANNSYDPAGTFPNVPRDFLNGPAPAITDHANGDIYSFANYGVHKWSQVSNSWSTLLSNTPVYGFSASSAVDTKRNRVLECGGERAAGTSVCYIYDIANNKLNAVQFSGIADSALDGAGGNMFYSAQTDSFYFRKGNGGGGSVYKIEASTMNLSLLPTIGGASVGAPVNEIWKRWLYSEKLGGAFYYPSYNSNIWFVRLH